MAARDSIDSRIPDEKGVHHDSIASDSAQISASAASDLDESYGIYKQHEGEEVSAEEAKKVLRKIDLRLIPALWLLYLLQYLDKNGINYASVYGLQEGTNLQGNGYSWLSSIFYFGYLAGQFPGAILMQRLPTGKFLSCTVLAWGVILLTTPGKMNVGDN